jgi:ZIP family zinc transporter
VSTGTLALLGLIAGGTILIGLPVGRVRHLSLEWRSFLNAAATGVLVFLLVDVLSHAAEPVEGAMKSAKAGDGGWGSAVLLAVVLFGGLGIGLLSLGWYERWMDSRRRTPQTSPGPGAMAIDERPQGLGLTATPARRLALLIAVGIGLHNFSEGLAIGQSAAAGEISLAVLLVVGFALHNATEGFGITAPLAGDVTRPSWPLLLTLGLIGGGPTFAGTMLGQSVTNDYLYVAFLALAAGSILYVVVQLLQMAQKLGHPRQFLYWGLFVGLSAGLVTDFVIALAGA